MNQQAREEWRAWRLIVSLLKDDGIDLNQRDALAAALRHWGDQFALLMQEPGTLPGRLKAADDAGDCVRLMEQRGI